MRLRDKVLVVLTDDGPRLSAMDIAERLHVSVPQVHHQLERLERAGRVSWVQEHPQGAWLWSLVEES